MAPNIYIQEIILENGLAFLIRWNDQVVQRFYIEKVQQHCPCAGCLNKEKKINDASPFSLTARRIISMGRYAIKITFSSGCSAGIYQFELLRQIGETIEGVL